MKLTDTRRPEHIKVSEDAAADVAAWLSAGNKITECPAQQQVKGCASPLVVHSVNRDGQRRSRGRG